MLFKLCNALMGMGFNMLGDGDTTNSTTSGGTGLETPIEQTSNEIINILNQVITVILSIAGVAIAIYGIVLLVQFLRADSAEKREEAKKRLIYALIGLVAAVVVIFVSRWIFNSLPDWLGMTK